MWSHSKSLTKLFLFFFSILFKPVGYVVKKVDVMRQSYWLVTNVLYNDTLTILVHLSAFPGKDNNFV